MVAEKSVIPKKKIAFSACATGLNRFNSPQVERLLVTNEPKNTLNDYG
jgi:hypothetical protein